MIVLSDQLIRSNLEKRTFADISAVSSNVKCNIWYKGQSFCPTLSAVFTAKGIEKLHSIPQLFKLMLLSTILSF